MKFGIMFFSNHVSDCASNAYKLLLDVARFADEHGFSSIATPERHFDGFGGIFPNPSITSAALAVITKNIQIRAASLVSPLHDEIRIAEEWSVIDNLSGGRVEISFGSGWNVNDFVFFPERYDHRHHIMYKQIEVINKLWSGETITKINSFEKKIQLKIYPRPVQKKLPLWITTSGNLETFKSAGKLGANILTHLIGQDLNSLTEKIKIYKQSLVENNFDPSKATITLMLHTFVSDDIGYVKQVVYHPFREYLRAAVKLENEAAKGGGSISGGLKALPQEFPSDLLEELLDVTFERYFAAASLMGTPESCQEIIKKLETIGVNEIACLMDFGISSEIIMKNMIYLAELKDRVIEENSLCSA
jgi:natural product biosynthesis luciferase-like monooxygenase protein